MGIYYMFISYVPSPPKVDEGLKKRMRTADVFNTGISRCPYRPGHKPGRFSNGGIFSPRQDGIDYATASGRFFTPRVHGLYDGSATVQENYEKPGWPTPST
jgi:hypothetical protein